MIEANPRYVQVTSAEAKVVSMPISVHPGQDAVVRVAHSSIRDGVVSVNFHEKSTGQWFAGSSIAIKKGTGTADLTIALPNSAPLGDFRVDTIIGSKAHDWQNAWTNADKVYGNLANLDRDNFFASFESSYVKQGTNPRISYFYQSIQGGDLVFEILDNESDEWITTLRFYMPAGYDTLTTNPHLDFLEAGNYRLQPYLTTPGGDWTSATAWSPTMHFQVY